MLSDPARQTDVEAASSLTSGSQSVGLRRSAGGSTGWLGLQQIATALLGAAAFFLLARFLAPSAFGLLAAAGAWITLVGIFVDGGLDRALIQRPLISRGHENVAFVASSLVGVIMCALVNICAGILPGQQNAAIVPVIRWLSLLLVISPFASVPEALMRRTFRYRVLSIRSIVAVAVGSVLGVACAIAGAGVWSLVVQQLSSALVSVGLVWLCSGWRPGFRFSRAEFLDIVPYGLRVLFGDVMVVLERNLDYIALAFFVSSAELGVYAVAFRVVFLVNTIIVSSISRSALPVLSRVNDSSTFGAAFSKTYTVAMLVTAPAFSLLIVVAPQLVTLGLGQKWVAAVPLVRLLAISACFQAATHVVVVGLQARGAPGIAARLLAIQTVAAVVIILALAPFGGLAVAIGLAIRSVLLSPFAAYYGGSRGDVPVRNMLRGLARPLVCCVFAGVAATSVASLGLIGPVHLLGATTAFLLVYCALVRLALWDAGQELMSTARAMLVRRGQHAPAS